MAISLSGILKGILIQNDTDRTKQVAIEAGSGATTGTRTTVTAAQTANRTLTLPNATDTLVGKATTDTLTNKTIDADGTGNSITNIENADIKAAAAIDATKIADGSISNTEFQYLNGVSSAIQTQLTANANAIADHLADATAAHAASAISNAPSGNLVATTAQAALDELQGDIDSLDSAIDTHIADADAAHQASAIANAPAGNLAATDVQAALDELQTDVDTRATSTALTDHINDASAAHAGTAIANTPAGTIAATTVQAAINEIDGDLTAHYADTSTHGVATVAGLSETQQFTNKDYDGGTASNTSRLTVPKAAKATLDGLTRKEGTLVYSTDLQELFVDDGSTLTQLGSGSGSGGINYILNPDAEINATGWATYSDAAASSPVDGTGGTATGVTFTRSTDVGFILRGDASFALDKDAANRQGKGASYDFTIDHADNGGSKPLYVSFDYKHDGTFASGDIVVYVYDRDSATLQAVLNGDSGAVMATQGSAYTGRFTGRIDTTYANDDYRLIFHIATTSTAAWTLFIDNVQVSPQTLVPGVIKTDPVAYTPTLTGFGTVSSNVAYSYREGSYLVAYGSFLSGTSTAVAAKISVGFNGGNANVTVDTSRQSAGTFCGEFAVGATGQFPSAILMPSANDTTVSMAKSAAGTNPLAAANGDTLAGSGQSVQWKFKVPIAGWTVGASVSQNEMVYAAAKARYTSAAGANLTSGIAIIDFGTKDYDTHSAVTTGGAWKFTAPKAGKYQIKGKVGVTYDPSADATLRVYIYKNGVSVSNANLGIPNAGGAQIWHCAVVDTISLAKGDYVDIRASLNTTQAMDADATIVNVSIEELPDFATFSVYDSPKPAFSVHRNSVTQSVNSGAATKVEWTHEEFDTNNNFDNATNYRFTPTVAGKYLLEANISFTVSVDTAIAGIYIYKNGAAYKYAQYHMSTTKAASAHISCITDANGTTDYFEVFAVQDTGAAKNLSGIPAECRFSGSRL